MHPAWPVLIAAVEALDALPADPAPARGEVVEVENRKVVQMLVWDDDPMVLCADGTMWWFSGSRQLWNALPAVPTTRLSLVKGDAQ